MKRKKISLVVFTALFTLLLQVPAFAQTTEELTEGFGLMDALRFFGMFFFIMGAIFCALLFTSWIGKQKAKRKK